MIANARVNAWISARSGASALPEAAAGAARLGAAGAVALDAAAGAVMLDAAAGAATLEAAAGLTVGLAGGAASATQQPADSNTPIRLREIRVMTGTALESRTTRERGGSL